MRTEMVGRERELAALVDCLDAALDGHPRFVLCRGEPGVGKTRLAEELSGLASGRGVPTVWALGVEASGAPPYWPWRQALRALSTIVDLTAIAVEHRLTDDLAVLAPDVFADSDDTGIGSATIEDRFRQFDSVGRLLRQVTTQQPVVMVIDDVHWADDPSLLLLQHIARAVTVERLLVVLNYRDTENLHGVLATEPWRESVTRRVELRGLDAAGVGRQLASVIGRDVVPADAERVHALTGGNPFFVGEMGRVQIDRDAGRAAASVTATVRDAIRARLGRLSPECVRLLGAASIVGREFSVAVVASMIDTPVLDCLGLLDEAVAAGLVEASLTSGERRFAHALVREAIEAGLGTADRVRLHRMAAGAIEKLHAGRLAPHLSDLARHWAAGAVVADDADRVRAVRWIVRAAEEAMRRLAFEEGVRLFRLALAVGDHELDEVEHCRIWLALGTALHRSGDLSGGLEACRQAATLARAVRRPDLLADAALIVEWAGPSVDPSEYDLAARRLCEEALAAQDPRSTALRARLSAHLAGLCTYLGDLDAAGSASERALSLAEHRGDTMAEVAALRARQLVCAGPDGLDERERLADQLLAVGRVSGNAATQMWAHWGRIDASFQRGDLARVARELQDLASCTDQVRGAVARWQLLRCRAALAQAEARFDDALRLTHGTSAEFGEIGHSSPLRRKNVLLTVIGHHIGQEKSGSLTANGLDAAPAGKEIPTAGVIMAIIAADQLVSAGRLDEAAGIYRRLGPVAGWQPRPHVETACYALGIPVAVALDASDDVATLRDLLARHRGQHIANGSSTVAYGGPVELYLGLAAGHLGELDDAVVELEHTAQVCALNGAAGFRVEAQYELAAALARRARPGDLPRARALAADSARQAVLLGMPPFAEKAGRLITRLGGDSTAGLTRREREVAELVADGLTNREIAERLYVSERTSQNHVQHILTKLDLPNRSQIAVWITTRNEYPH